MKEVNENVMLPEGSCKLNTEEMRAVEGGVKVHISHSVCNKIVDICGLAGILYVNGVVASAVSIPVVASAISAASGAVASAIAALNPVLAVLSGVTLAYFATDLAIALVDETKKGKGIDLHLDWTSTGPSLDFKARKK